MSNRTVVQDVRATALEFGTEQGIRYERQVLLVLLLITAFVVSAISLASVMVFYRAEVDQEQMQLLEAVRSRADLFNAVYRFDRAHSADFPGGHVQATLTQFKQVHEGSAGSSRASRFGLVQRRPDGDLVWVLSYNHENLIEADSRPIAGGGSEPMRRAARGLSGTYRGTDERGVEVIAAYAPVDAMGMGMVASQPLTEIREPFLAAAAWTITAAGLLLALAMVLGKRLAQPYVRRVTETEERYRALLDQSPDSIFLQRDGKVIYVNDAVCDLIGVEDPSDLVGRSLEEFVHPDSLVEMRKRREQLVKEGGKLSPTEMTAIRSDGTPIPVEVNASLVHLDGVPTMQSVIRDISGRRSAETKFRQVLEDAPLAAVSLDPEGCVIFANRRLLELTGWTADETIGRNWFDTFMPAEARSQMLALFQETMRGGPKRIGTHHTNEILSRNGGRLLVSWYSVLSRDSWGGVTGITCMGIDVTEKARMEASLDRERRLLQTVLETLSDGVIACDATGNIQIFNHAARAVCGLDADAEIGDLSDQRRLVQFLDVDAKTPIRNDDLPIARALRGESVRDAEMAVVPPGMPVRFVSVNAEPMPADENRQNGAVGTIRNITDHRETEIRLRHAQKMEAVGQLTGGIAHDFNNLLQVVETSLALIQETAELHESAAASLDLALQAGRRGGNLTRQLLAFSRKQALEPRMVRLNELIEGMLKLLSRTLGEHIHLTTDLDSADIKVMIDENGFENALLNLALNARAAMPSGGTLTVRSKTLAILDRIDVDDAYLPPGDYVEISVADTGCGMPDDVLERAFEPFFTTKGVGEGSGLGLSMVYGFVRQSGGILTL